VSLRSERTKIIHSSISADVVQRKQKSTLQVSHAGQEALGPLGSHCVPAATTEIRNRCSGDLTASTRAVGESASCEEKISSHVVTIPYHSLPFVTMRHHFVTILSLSRHFVSRKETARPIRFIRPEIPLKEKLQFYNMRGKSGRMKRIGGGTKKNHKLEPN
jgi:hypothetical protein